MILSGFVFTFPWRFEKDVELMIGRGIVVQVLMWYFRFCWSLATPVMLIVSIPINCFSLTLWLCPDISTVRLGAINIVSCAALEVWLDTDTQFCILYDLNFPNVVALPIAPILYFYRTRIVTLRILSLPPSPPKYPSRTTCSTHVWWHTTDNPLTQRDSRHTHFVKRLFLFSLAHYGAFVQPMQTSEYLAGSCMTYALFLPSCHNFRPSPRLEKCHV